jgi:hypothetical protein
MEPPRSPTSSKMGRGARRRKNEREHVDGELLRARRCRQRDMRAWMETTSEEERARLADRLLAAMDREDQATVPRRGELYKSWVDRRRDNDYVATMPITLLPVSLPEVLVV